MSDSISIWSNSEGLIHVPKLIAFLPNEGYIIFEGYHSIKKENLPCNIKIHRYQSRIDFCGYFEADLIEVYKKDLRLHALNQYTNKSNECYEDISLYPLDIIILKIKITKKCSNDDFPSINWSYCIDNRFSSMDELILKYTSLLDMPEDTIDKYVPRKEDTQFYKEYYRAIEDCKDVFLPQYNEAIEAKKFKGLINGSRKTPRPPSTEVLGVIEKWYNLQSDINTKLGNKPFLKNCLKLFDYIDEQIPFLLKWCAEYLCDLPFQDKLRGWLTYGIKMGTNRNLSDFEKHWKLFFRKNNNEPDIITLDDTDFDISYNHYILLVAQKKEEMGFEKCNIEEINNIHKDLECTDWMCCDLCDEQEALWHTHVTKKYKTMNNIFINRELGELFIEKWLNAVLELSDTEQEKINFIWPPPRHYYFTKWFLKNKYYTLDEYISNLIKERDNTYYGYYPRPKVEFEFIRDFIGSLDDYSLSNIYPFKESLNKFNEIYLSLSYILGWIQNALYIDRKRCNELVEIFSRLLDD
jgi:hypothetical protein